MDRKFMPVCQLPSPGAGRLILRMRCGKEIEGVRPEYIENRNTREMGYRDLRGNDVSKDVIEWSHK